MTVPVFRDPVGDPGGVRVGARRLAGAAGALGESGRVLSDLNQAAVQAWESTAQRLFSIVADMMSQVIGGSGGVTTDIAGALDRYANILESCQGEVRLCRQRLQSLVASTPVGMVPDPVVVNSITAQANNAYARAGQAARELSATALNLIGNPTGNAVLTAPHDANASFVSQAHTGGLASTHPSAAGFDVQAVQIQTQMNGAMNSLTGLAGSAPSLSGSSRVVVDPNAFAPKPLTVFNTGQPTLLAQYPGSAQVSNPENLVMVVPPFSSAGYGGSMAIMVDTSMKANPAAPTGSLGAADVAYRATMISLSEPRSPSIENLFDRPNAYDTWLRNDTYSPILDRNNNPWDSI